MSPPAKGTILAHLIPLRDQMLIGRRPQKKQAEIQSEFCLRQNVEARRTLAASKRPVCNSGFDPDRNAAPGQMYEQLDIFCVSDNQSNVRNRRVHFANAVPDKQKRGLFVGA
jgi:hypothetical protein